MSETKECKRYLLLERKRFVPVSLMFLAKSFHRLRLLRGMDPQDSYGNKGVRGVTLESHAMSLTGAVVLRTTKALLNGDRHGC